MINHGCTITLLKMGSLEARRPTMWAARAPWMSTKHWSAAALYDAAAAKEIETAKCQQNMNWVNKTRCLKFT